MPTYHPPVVVGGVPVSQGYYEKEISRLSFFN